MYSILLTPTEWSSNLAPLLPHAIVGIRTPITTGQKAAYFAVFYCPSKIINTGLIRIKSFMVGCFGHSSEWLVPVAGSSNPKQPATQRFEPKSGGYIPNTGKTAMRNITQNHTKSVSDTENELIELSQVIGSIADSNSPFTSGLARFIDKTGKPLSEMTLAELSALIKLYRNAFNTGIEPSIEQVIVSPTKAKSLHKQHDIIGHSLEIFCLEPNEINRAYLKVDTLELTRMLDDLPPSPKKTSCFNVLSRTRRLIAERVSFNQAMQYQDCIVKFAGMEALS